MDKNWSDLIVKNFGQASINYNKEADLQKNFAWLLAKQCIKETIPKGIWVDLGAGTGLLSEALETLNPKQKVLRVDASEEMLSQNSIGSQTQLWDLNFGLPKWSQKPTLIASSFALHWLNEPSLRIEEWFSALPPGGLLAVALPVKGSFKEWHCAAEATGLHCTALDFPCSKFLLEGLQKTNIRYQHLHCYKQKASNINSLLKPIIKVGAHTSQTASLSVGEWRRLYKAWPDSTENETVTLTWLVQLLLIQR